MIASWMIYAIVVGLVITAAALVAERVLLLMRRPVRGVWAVALSASLLIPCLSHFFPRLVPIPSLLQTTIESARPPATIRMRDAGTAAIVRASKEFPLDRVLQIGWIAAALGLSQLMLYSMAVLHGRRREWRRQTVNGVEALIAPEFGPAVVGWRKLEIVLPEWALELADDARALVVRHEVEHVGRKDPRLLLHAFFVVIAMPWNPALWWQFRRLRRAIELDCDARVVGSGVSVARYGEVLIEAVGFCRSAGLPALATFAERSSDLEARIKALAPVAPRRPMLQAGLGAAAALMLAAAACLVPDPLSPELTQRIVDKVSAAAPTGPASIAWVRAHLEGVGPTDVVILVRSSTGQLLSKELMRKSPDSRRTEKVGGGPGVLQDISNDSIESIEVVKGAALGVAGINGVIVVTLKPGVQLPVRVTRVWFRPDYSNPPLTLRHWLGMARGTMQIVFMGKTLEFKPANRRVPPS